MFLRLGNAADHFAHGRALPELIDPHVGPTIGGALEHVTVDLIDDTARVCRARLLSRRDRWHDHERADEHRLTQHTSPPFLDSQVMQRWAGTTTTYREGVQARYLQRCA